MANTNRKIQRFAIWGFAGITVGLMIYNQYIKHLAYSNSLDVFSVSKRKGKLPKQIEHLLDNKYSIGKKKLYYHYHKYETNHQLHAVVALYYLGVSSANIIAFMNGIATEMLDTPDIYQKQHPDKDVLGQYECKWNQINKYLGKSYNYYGIRQMFENDLKTEYKNNINKMIADRYPLISCGLVGGALHSLIHIGYGLSVNNTEGIIDGLTFAVFKSVKLNKYNFRNNNKVIIKLSFNELLNKLRNDTKIFLKIFREHKNEKYAEVSLSNRVIILSKYIGKEMTKYLFLLKIPDIKSKNDLKIINKWLLSNIIDLYTYNSNGNDFFLLHCLTSSWAMTQILPYLNNIDDIKNVLDDLLLAIIYLYIAVGVPKIIKKIENKISKNIQKDIVNIIHDKILPNYNTNKNICKKYEFVSQEHQVKVCQILMECLEMNIIDKKTAFDGVVTCSSKLFFGPPKVWN